MWAVDLDGCACTWLLGTSISMPSASITVLRWWKLPEKIRVHA
jgi:hypothetical protein